MSKVLPLPGTLRVELSELILLSVCMPVILVQLRGKRPVYPLKSKRKLRLLSEVTGKTRRKPFFNFKAVRLYLWSIVPFYLFLPPRANMPLRGSTTAVFLPQPNNGAVTASQTAPEQRVVWGGTHS